MPYNWACVCMMRPCSWDSSPCLPPVLSHLSLILQGVWNCLEEQEAWPGKP